MDIAHIARTRYTTKAFDPTRKIPAPLVEQLETLLRYSPSSANTQPWHYFVAHTDEGKERIARSMTGFYAYNVPKVLNASHVVVFCTRATIDEAYLLNLLDQEDRDGRYAKPEFRENQHRLRHHFVDMHRFELRDAQHWMEKQVYLAVGTLLLGAAVLGIDAGPMEGFEQKVLDEELGLRALGYTSAVIVNLGYRSESDYNANLPKSRLPAEDIITKM